MKPLVPDAAPALQVGQARELGQELAEWFATPPGRYLLEWEQGCCDEAVVDRFGFNALQLGLPECDALRTNRMPNRWVSVPEDLRRGAELAGALHEPGSMAGVSLVSHAAALPFPENSLDLVVLPHTLELSADPHAVLREVERVLVPEGRLVICGMNPLSLWGLSQFRAHALTRIGLGKTRLARRFVPEIGAFIAPWRLRDWLKLLSFEVESCHYGAYRPAVRSELWLRRWSWMDRAGARFWPFLGAVYFLVAVKRVKGMHMLGPAWRPLRSSATPVAVAHTPSMDGVKREPLSKEIL